MGREFFLLISLFLFTFIFFPSLSAFNFDTSGTSTTVTTIVNITSNYQGYYNSSLINTTTLEDQAGKVSVKQSFLQQVFNWLFGTKTTDDLTQGTVNLYENQSWNQSLSQQLHYLKSETYNQTEIVDLIPSMLTYYFWDVNSTIVSTYKIMNITQNPAITSHRADNLLDNAVIVWRLNEKTNLTGLTSGRIRVHTTALKTAGTKNLQIYGQAHIRFTNGTETLIGTTETSPVLITGTSTNIDLSAVVPQLTFSVNDMLLWRLVADTSGGGTDPSVNITVGETTNNGLDIPVSISQISLTESDPKAYNGSLMRVSGGNFTGSVNITNANFSISQNSFICYTTLCLSNETFNGTCTIKRSLTSTLEIC